MMTRTNRYMPLEYRFRLYSIARDITSYYEVRGNDYNKKHNYSEIPSGFARECLIDFAKAAQTTWFIDKGIAISVETYVDMNTYQYRADLIAHMTQEKREEWREMEIIDKLQNSYKNNNVKIND